MKTNGLILVYKDWKSTQSKLIPIPDNLNIMSESLKVQTMRGPNYWSIRQQKLIVLRLDLAELTQKRSDEIPDF